MSDRLIASHRPFRPDSARRTRGADQAAGGPADVDCHPCMTTAGADHG